MIVLLAVLGVGVFAAYHIVPFFYYNFELVNQMEALVAAADRNNDAVIRKRVAGIIKELGIPAEEGDIQIERSGGIISIVVPYQEVFYVSFRGKDYDLYAFPFRASVSGAF